MGQIKILHIIKKSSYDGASVFPIRLIEYLEQFDHKLLSIYKGSAHKEIIDKNINYHCLLGDSDDNLKNKFLKFIFFVKHLINNEYNIIHYHLGGVGILLLATLFRKKAKVIHHIHSGNIVGNIYSNKLSFFQKTILLFLKNKNIQIAVAENVEEFYQNALGNSNNLKIIKNFTPFEFKKKETFPIKGIGYLGRIVEEKGVNYFLSTIKYLEKIDINLKYYMKGDVYDYSDPIERLIEIRKLELFPPSFKIEEIFEKIDLLIFPSIAPESFGLVLVEATSFDIGVIALRSKVVDEILDNYPLIIDELQTEQIVEKIEEYYSNEKLRKDLSNIHFDIAQKYSKDKALTAIRNIYEKVKVKY